MLVNCLFTQVLFTICSLEGRPPQKISKSCQQIRRLPHKLIFSLCLFRDQTTKPNDFRQEKYVLALGHILFHQKSLVCKQTAEGLLYFTPTQY